MGLDKFAKRFGNFRDNPFVIGIGRLTISIEESSFVKGHRSFDPRKECDFPVFLSCQNYFAAVPRLVGP